jgi:hypothetical protein
MMSPAANYYFLYSHYATSIIFLLGTPVIAITLVLVVLERALNLGIFNPKLGGDPLLFQHLFWFYSHPAVYIMILPAMGVVSEIIPCFSRKRSVTKLLISELERTVSCVNEREKLVPSFFLTESPQHGGRYCGGVLFFDSAHHHAQMSRFNDYTHTLRSVFNTFNEFVGEIATVRADGTDFRLLSSPVWDSLGAMYTGDGKHIVFSTTTGGYVAALWIMDTNGKHQRRLTKPELEAGAPDISADGKDQVVFYNHQNTPLPTSCVFKMNLDGTGARCLTGMRHVNTLPVFSPDGTKILYMSDRLSPGSFDIWVMDADGSHKKRVIQNAFVPNWGTQPEH